MRDDEAMKSRAVEAAGARDDAPEIRAMGDGAVKNMDATTYAVRKGRGTSNGRHLAIALFAFRFSSIVDTGVGRRRGGGGRVARRGRRGRAARPALPQC